MFGTLIDSRTRGYLKSVFNILLRAIVTMVSWMILYGLGYVLNYAVGHFLSQFEASERVIDIVKNVAVFYFVILAAAVAWTSVADVFQIILASYPHNRNKEEDHDT